MNRIKELRKEKHISQQKLADMLKVHQTAVSQWETARTTPDMASLTAMARLFEVSTDYLLGLDHVRLPAPPLDEQLSGIDFALYREASELNETDKEDVIHFIQYLKSKKK